MFRPDSTAYLQVSTGYAIPHGLPDYTFNETPLRLSDSRDSAAAGAVGSSASALLYNTPLFSDTRSAGIGPAPSALGSFNNFHSTSSTSPANPTISARSSHRPSLPLLLKMEPNAEDLAAQEAAAREYQPHLERDAQGPLVGKKTPSTAIAEEYAKADPIYVQKTLVLPQTYSHYRQIQGDGNCGWRAIGFGYFEMLVKSGNKTRIETERQRLEGLNGFIENVGGFSPYVSQDFVDETLALLQKMAELVDQQGQDQAMTELLEAFNTPELSNSIMYHFRMLASSFLKGNRDTYGAFVTTASGVDGYCTEVLEHHGVELDHLGLTLLVNVLLKDAGFVLEVAYLDRSPGSEVNTYRFPDEANNRDPSELGPIIHLLYRPDHYDILYVPEPVSLQVHRVASFSHSYEIESSPMSMHNFGAVDMQTLSLIPGFGAPAPALGSMLDTSPSPLTTYSPSPVSPWLSSGYVEPVQQAPPVPLPIPTPTPAPQTHPLRFSEYCQLREYTDNNTWREQTLQTTTFKNSHFNVAHYNNPNFQPEEYKPGADDHDTPPRPSGRKRGSV
ncbi:cysteine proteinase [Parathielavia appendiculata]|uniref:ubiquitinyl hydrolase 1 n=1 Tax=Parathielavia appendiculata TaxID=2587402 RepID=A0AAN6U2I8_9PEZI|nr:cysteine proteinase [Parathielavia appendiculata]